MAAILAVCLCLLAVSGGTTGRSSALASPTVPTPPREAELLPRIQTPIPAQTEAVTELTPTEAASCAPILVSAEGSERPASETEQEPVRITYGTSGTGRYPLTAYRFGSGGNVLVLTFALHGFDDGWSRDGQELVYLALAARDWLTENPELVRDGSWTVYVLPCLNPDGLNLGTTGNGPGRCTLTYYNANGELVRDGKRGIDMNRCFPYCFSSSTASRYYNAGMPLRCPEAEALANFLPTLKGTGKNILIDVHGWYSQVITSDPGGVCYQSLQSQFPRCSYSGLRGCPGYFSSWAAFTLGFESCLLELPGSIHSHADLLSQQIPERFNAALEIILQSTCPAHPFIDTTE